MSGKVLAWHFCDGYKLRDGSPLEVGKTYEIKPPIKICERGLHASHRAIDALKYAPGTVICRVECWGIQEEHKDKFVGTHRKIIAAKDANKILHEFACCIAENTLGDEGIEDRRSWYAIEAKRLWISGLITDEDLSAASSAARSAAISAARSAKSAARSAKSAARSAESEMNNILESELKELLNCE